MDDAAPPRTDQAVLDDLRARLRAYRAVEGTGEHGWDRGTEPGYLAELLASWAGEYDWRPHEERIRALPWQLAGGLRVVHQRAADPAAPAVVLLHGWPDSVLRYERVLPLLTDVHVVVPALPGYPFAAPLPERDLSSAEMAPYVAAAMTELGYDRYVVSGGDIGRFVATSLALHRPDDVAALHLTDVPLFAAFTSEPASDEERDLRERVTQWRAAEGGYMHEHATKPHTLAVALGDSPAGLAAWIVEKLRSWSDCGGDVEQVFTRDELLTWVTAYWVSGSIGTSFAPYAKQSPPFERIDVPTVVQQFPGELVRSPRSVAERLFDLRGWRDETAGGHFAAWERPEEFVAGVREALALA
ncbi:epoxide hydrolase family protein [Modestobacter versicolor]|uniref:Enterotoxin n=1 Tax=Modestobacter versicolor TaxID=429133 RepID=A0A323VAH4_9ACTN|nr:epoxide hydrolase [Modestobacter versicolor]MBB3674387.1 pimeloyl-ACP methyl ester carboxylesterase [Modestobacter versicolor]PZA21695.1 enterotoxin [Modestobacter versicolor]